MSGKRPVYEITTEDGAKYNVEADDDAQAGKIADFINAQHKAGKTDPDTWTDIPDHATVANTKKGYDSSLVGAGARGVARGASLNFFDELAAAGNTVIPYAASVDRAGGIRDQHSMYESGKGFWDTFNANMKDLATLNAADQDQHYGAERAGEVGGTIGSSIAGGGLLAKAAAKVAPRLAIPLAARVEASALARPGATAAATAAATGGAAGAVSGFGAGDTLASREQSAAIGGLGGTILGGAVGGTVAKLAPAIGRYWSVLAGRGSKDEAVGQVVKALARDGYDVTSPAAVQALRTELGRYAGKPVSLADIGSATRARAGVGLRAPSAVQQQSIDQVISRSAGQGARLAQDVRATVAPRTDVHALDQALVDQRATQALPLRQEALYTDGPQLESPVPPAVQPALPNAGPPAADAPDNNVAITSVKAMINNPQMEPHAIVRYAQEQGLRVTEQDVQAARSGGAVSRIADDPVLQNLVRLPDAQKALQASLQRANAERDLLAVQGKDISHLPDLHAGSDLDMRTLDNMKRFLDDEVNSLYRKGDTATFKAGQANQVKELRNAIRDRMRAVVPQYGDYLDSYSGSSDMIDALHAGRDFTKLDPEQIAAEQTDRSGAAQELYRVGAARDILDTIKGTPDGANSASRALNSQEARDQLAATGVRPEDAAHLNTSIQQERTLNLLPAELGGSQTAQRVAAAQDANAGVDMTVPFNPASKASWLAALARGIGNRASLARNAGVNESLLPRLIETNPQAIDNIINELAAHGQTAQAEILRRQAQAVRAARATGLVIGSPLAKQEDQ